jgi:hypothetical protein
MKLMTTIFICLILVSSSLYGQYGPGEGIIIAGVVILGGEIALITAGISNLSNNTSYLNGKDSEKPSVTGGIALGTVNVLIGGLILSSDSFDNSNWIKAISISQMAIGLAGIATSIAVENKSVTYGPAVLYDSGQKAVAGLNLNLRF